MVELRKRPARADPPSAPPAKRSSSKSNAKAPAGGASKVKQLANKAKEAVTGTPITASTPAADEAKPTSDLPVASETGVIPETTGTAGEGIESAPATTSTGGGGADASSKLSHDSVGKKINLTNDFGGKISTHEGKSVTLADLLKQGAASKGVVIFTYPKASTPGCTTQACLFRDNYKPLQEAGYAAYGLSSDSEKANGGFVAKQGLPFPLLCDPNATLTGAIGMKKPGPGKGTTRGVVLIDREGVVKVWEQAGPQKTLDAVLEFVGK